MSAYDFPPVLLITPWHPFGVAEANRLEEDWHDPRSAYVERFWLPVIGPSTTFLLRRLADGFDFSPKGFEMDCVEMSHSLGLGVPTGRHAPFNRALVRLIQHSLAGWDHVSEYHVRLKVPPLDRRLSRRLTPAMRLALDEWRPEKVNWP